MIKGWSFLKIKDYPIQIIDGDRGTNYPTKEEFLQDGYCLFLNTGNVTLSGFHFDEKAFVTEEKHKKLRKGHLQRYDSVLTTRGTIGNVAFYGDSIPYDVVRINSGMLILRPDQSKLDPRFFYGLLRSSIFQQQADLFRYGAAQPQLPITTLKHIRLPLPPLPIQQKVAGILSAYDDLIENNLKRIKLLEEMAQITYEEWFVRLRFPGHESTPISSETGLPEGWTNENINTLYRIKYGKNLPQTDISDKGQYPVYGASGVMGYYHERNADKKIALITSRGNGSADVHRTYEPAFVTNNSFLVLPNKGFEHLELAFTINLLKLAGLKNYCSGAAQPQLTNDALKGLTVVLPSRMVIEAYNNEVMPAYEAADNLRVQNQRLREARDILLPRLMTGVIDVESYDPAQLLKEAA